MKSGWKLKQVTQPGTIALVIIGSFMFMGFIVLMRWTYKNCKSKKKVSVDDPPPDYETVAVPPDYATAIQLPACNNWEIFEIICDGLPMNFDIYIWRWTWSQFAINQKLLDEVKWGQQWGPDIEYIKVLSVKAMKGHIWNWIWNFSRNNYRILILMLWVLIVLIKN